MSWLIAVVVALVVVVAFVLSAQEPVVSAFVVAVGLSVPLWLLFMVTGRPARRDEGKK